MAGLYDCDSYCINGLILESRKRREHLSRDDLQKNKAIMESLTKGGGQSQSIDQNGEVCYCCLTAHFKKKNKNRLMIDCVTDCTTSITFTASGLPSYLGGVH